jgi:hypothetical protein
MEENTILPIFNDDGTIKVEEGVVPELSHSDEDTEAITPVIPTVEDIA